MEDVSREQLDSGITALRFLRTRFMLMAEEKDGTFEVPIAGGDPGLSPEVRGFVNALASVATSMMRMVAELSGHSTEDEIRPYVLGMLDDLIEASTLQALSTPDSGAPPPA